VCNFAEDRYATLFYAQYDPVSRRFTYVNAGHNQPMVSRYNAENGHDSSAGHDRLLERLDEEGDPVVGLLKECQYEQAEIALVPGDVLVLYTDGISEAMNADLEEWGEERLITAAKLSTHLSAQDNVTAVIASADRFTAGAPQNDDLSLVVLKVL